MTPSHSLSYLLFFLHCILNRRTPSASTPLSCFHLYTLFFLSLLFSSLLFLSLRVSMVNTRTVSLSFLVCFHGGLAKGFLQSLLAFCPPPHHGKSPYFSPLVFHGGGHTANWALLASLCKILVMHFFQLSSHSDELPGIFTTSYEKKWNEEHFTIYLVLSSCWLLLLAGFDYQ
ncbi:hypothetical protein E1A91_A05G194800v1 [Gossypium mustelinum]|uniref:Uncharacterized protein n=2 Tax=Gossypium TaxID=3633 RepID=A0A5D2Z8E3_GOSMU|nr:hypothetical protein E1A91_A05G194800v1 [Gossypium mustelinum]